VQALARKMKINLSQIQGSGTNGEITLADVRTANACKRAEEADADTTVSADFSPNVRAAPRVRAEAAEAGVDIRRLDATGHRGNITLQDVKNTRRAAHACGQYELPERAQDATGEPLPVRGERRAMALNMARARDLTVNTTVTDRAFIDHWPEGTDISVRLVRAVAAASRVEPALNAWFDGETMERTLHRHVNLGLAVDSPHGLSVPVIKKADTLSPEQIRTRINQLRKAVQNKSINPEDLQDGGITLSNFGMIAGLYATPIVIPPQVASIGTGRIAEELRLTDRGIVNSRYIPISLSFDHRGVTGGDAVRFLAAFVADLSLPY
jgi:pyruvate dehydrogenase E2 component (dihydrolipoamide acetyltransferase)